MSKRCHRSAAAAAAQAPKRRCLECSICHESVSVAPDRIQLVCLHVFHCKCLSRWLSLFLTCPVCRAAVDLNDPLLSPIKDLHERESCEQEARDEAEDQVDEVDRVILDYRRDLRCSPLNVPCDEDDPTFVRLSTAASEAREELVQAEMRSDQEEKDYLRARYVWAGQRCERYAFNALSASDPTHSLYVNLEEQFVYVCE